MFGLFGNRFDGKTHCRTIVSSARLQQKQICLAGQLEKQYSFVKDLQTGIIDVTTLNFSGTPLPISPSNGSVNYDSVIFSEDSNFIVYEIRTSIFGSPFSSLTDLYMKNVHTGEITKISTDTNGQSATSFNGGDVFNRGASISADGRYIAFESTGSFEQRKR